MKALRAVQPAPKRILVLAAFALAISLLLLAPGGVLRRKTINRWFSLGAPPGGAVEIVSVEPDYASDTTCVTVKGAVGEYFRQCEGNGGWVEVALPSGSRGQTCEEATQYTPLEVLDKAPGEILDCAAIVWSWEYVGIQTHYAIIEDGTVWMYRYRHGSILGLYLTIFAPIIAALFAGLVVLVVVIVVVRRHFKNR